MSEKVKLLGMEDYPEDMTQHIRDPKVWKENGRYFPPGRQEDSVFLSTGTSL